jgi:signal transduction histidine kinase
MAEVELQRVSHITRQTLSFYRESKQPSAVQVSDLLDDVMELQDHEVRTNHIVVQRQYCSSCVVHGFPVELRQIFLNLVINSVQAMPEGGSLRLRVNEATDWTTLRHGAAISIIDTGAGVKPEDAKRLFEPFFSTKPAKGTGLGLWISKGIAQKYNGRISFRSYQHARGAITCFRVFIPVNEAPNTLVNGDGQAVTKSEMPRQGQAVETVPTEAQALAVPAMLSACGGLNSDL